MKHIHGGDIYSNPAVLDFSANINPLGPTEHMLQAMAECLPKVGNYPDVSCHKLRAFIAEKEGVEAEAVTCGNGAAEVLFSLVLAVKPKRALLITPTFAEYEQALLSMNCQIRYYPLHPENGFSLTEAYLRELSQDLDIIFLCSPNNPVGNTISKELLVKILKLCKEKHILFVLDECFMDFLLNAELQTMSTYVMENPQLFLIKSFTKMHAIPGVRLGYGLSNHPPLIKRLEQMRQPWNVSLIAQEAGIAALQEVDFERQTRLYIKEQRTYLLQEMKRLGMIFYEPEANYIFLKSEYDLIGQLQQQGILIRDCSNYRGLCKGYYRIAVKLEHQNKKLIQALERVYQTGGMTDGKANYDIGNHVKCG